jgi:endonuclease/exonuclease/phosphatase family metal-dependent hydrolase
VCLAGSFVLTGARLFTPASHTGVLVTAFVPWAVPGYLLAAVLFGLVVVGAGRRWRPMVGALVALAGLVLHLVWLAPAYIADPESGRASEAARLRVMTLNLQFGRADTSSVARLVQREQPDVLVLEETTPEALARLVAAHVGDASSPWRHHGGQAAPGARGTVVLSRYRLVDDGPLPIGNGGARLRVLAPRPFTLLAVHLRYPLHGVSGWLEDFRTLTAESRRTTGPQLVVGDFNATLDHAPMRTLLGTGLTDADDSAGSGWQPTWPRPGSRSVRSFTVPIRLMAIDHVLLSDDLTATSTSTCVVPDTDHLALVVDLVQR